MICGFSANPAKNHLKKRFYAIEITLLVEKNRVLTMNCSRFFIIL